MTTELSSLCIYGIAVALLTLASIAVALEWRGRNK